MIGRCGGRGGGTHRGRALPRRRCLAGGHGFPVRGPFFTEIGTRRSATNCAWMPAGQPLRWMPCSTSTGAKQPASPGFGPQSGSQNRDCRQDRSRASHLARSSGISPKLTPDLSESRSRVPCFLTCLFFCSRWWDTLFSPVGHPALRRQEAGRDDVGIDATRAPLTRDDALLRPVGPDGGTPCSWAVPWPRRGCGRRGSTVRCGRRTPTRFCSVQCRCRRTVRYRSRVTGTNESKGASGVAAQPARKRLASGTLRPWQERGLRKSARLGEARRCQTTSFPGFAGYADPPFRRVLLYGFWCRGLAQMEPCAQRIPRARVSVAQSAACPQVCGSVIREKRCPIVTRRAVAVAVSRRNYFLADSLERHPGDVQCADRGRLIP